MGGAPGCGGGGVALGRSAFHLILDCCNETSSDFSYPPDSDRSKSIFLFRQSLTRIVYFACRLPPPLFSSHHHTITPSPPPPLPHVLYICIMSGWARTFLFFPPLFPSSSNSQEVVVFWQQCQWDQNCKGFLLIQKG
jgi:hypothetical protein